MSEVRRCPSCGIPLLIVAATLPPNRLVACPNQRGGCGKQWWTADGRKHWLPQMLRVR